MAYDSKLSDVVDDAVVVAVPDQQAVVAGGPGGFLRKAVAGVVEVHAVGLRGGLDAVVVQVEDDRADQAFGAAEVIKGAVFDLNFQKNVFTDFKIQALIASRAIGLTLMRLNRSRPLFSYAFPGMLEINSTLARLTFEGMGLMAVISDTKP